MVLPITDYTDIVYQNTSDIHLKPLNVLFNSLCRFILHCPYRTHHCYLYESLNWLQPKFRRQFHRILFLFKCVYLNFPLYLQEFLVPCRSYYPLTRLQYPFFFAPRIFKEIGRRAFKYKAPSDWNNLPVSLISVTSRHRFKTSLFSYLKTPCSCFKFVYTGFIDYLCYFWSINPLICVYCLSIDCSEYTVLSRSLYCI